MVYCVLFFFFFFFFLIQVTLTFICTHRNVEHFDREYDDVVIFFRCSVLFCVPLVVFFFEIFNLFVVYVSNTI